MKNEEQELEIDLMQLARVLWKKAKLILVITIVMGILGMLGSMLFLTPIYEASAKMIVNTRKDETQNVTSDQLNSAKNLVDTYAIIIRSRDVLNRVIDELKLSETYQELYDCVQVNAVNSTQVMEVTVRHEDRNTALKVAAKILQIAPDVIVETVEAGSVKPVEQAYVGADPVSPDNLKNGVLLALIGFVLTCGVIIVVFLTDTTYKSELDIQNDLNLPVLGVIPTIESCGSHTGYGYKDKSAKGRK